MVVFAFLMFLVLFCLATWMEHGARGYYGVERKTSNNKPQTTNLKQQTSNDKPSTKICNKGILPLSLFLPFFRCHQFV